MQIRRAMALCVVLLFAAGAPLVLAQDAKKEQEKRSKEERQDIEALFKMLAEVQSGKQPAPSDIGIDWVRQYFARANDDKTYVPYTVTLDPAAMTNKNAVILLRVVESAPADTTPAATSGQSEQRKNGDKDKVEYPWEDIYLVDLSSPAGAYTLNRAFQVAGGTYEVLLAVRERTAGRKNAPPPKATVLRRTIEVPDFTGVVDLATSSLFVADNLESVSAAPTREEQRENPYTFGTLRIHPAADSEFKKSEQLNLWFWLYGVQPNDTKKPDVTVEFNFHAKTPEGEKFFNKTAPREFNPQTVPPTFEMMPGFGLPVEFSVPLATFPPGDYRLEIKATDKTSGKTLTRDVVFTVDA